MPKTEQIKTKLAQVLDILTRLPETRDNDRELIAAYWRTERPLLFAFNNADAVLRAIINKELSNPDDITRARRKVQELHPALRGAQWKQHQRRDNEADVRANINKSTFNVGDKVNYCPPWSKQPENGIVKALADDGDYFVVYQCGGNWGDYAQYTAAKTPVEFVKEGWI